MKRLLADLILAGLLCLSVPTVWTGASDPAPDAQTNDTVVTNAVDAATNAAPSGVQPAESQPSETQTNAVAAISTNAPPDLEKILLITFEDPPAEIIKALAEQAHMNLQMDPRILNGIDAGGKPLEKWADSVSVRWTNLTALEALEEFLARYGMKLVRDADGKVLRVTYPGAAQNETPGTNAVATAEGEKAPEDGKAGKEELAPIRIQEQPVLDAVTTLADMAKINFQFDPRVTSGLDAEGKPFPFLTNVITLKWENVTARDALEQVLANHNLMLIQPTNSRIARVTFRPAPAQEPLVTRVIQLKYAAPTNMTLVLKSNLSDRSKVNVDTRTSSLIIQTTEREYAVVDDILAKLDTPTRQVLIEAKMLETAMNPKTVKGVDWTETLGKQNVSFGNGVSSGSTITTIPGASASASTLPSGRPVTGGSAPYSSQTTLETSIGAGGLSADTSRGFFPKTGFLNADGLKVALSFLNSESDTEVVATPSAVTLDNEMAKLSFSKLYPIFKVTPGSANSPAGSDITYTNLGTVLEVTPRIAADDQISLKVSPEVSNIDSVDRKTVNNFLNEANVYAVRRMDTHVLIPSGNTMVMGGLVNDTKTKIQNKVPLFGDIPVLGAAFRYSNKGQNKVNLIIFITPTIVQDSDFQPTESKLLKTSWKKTEEEHIIEKPASSWDSAEPKDWSKKKKSKKAKESSE